MKKSSQKQIKIQHDAVVGNSGQKKVSVWSNISNVKKEVVNNFKGMTEDLEWFEPVIIPGYKTRG